MRTRIPAVVLVALVACGEAARPAISNRASPQPELLVFASWEALWQLRRDGHRAWLTHRTPREAVEYEGTFLGGRLVVRDPCPGANASAELQCTWETMDIYPADARMRQGCVQARDRWTARGAPWSALVCEVADLKGAFPVHLREMVFIPGLAIESTHASCDRGSVILIHTGYRVMRPAQARAARGRSRPRCK